ncbi:MAG: TRAP transporter permease [Peptococcaceae bacterium]
MNIKAQNKPLLKYSVYAMAFLLSIIHVANVIFVFPSNVIRGLHLAFVLALIYLGGLNSGKNKFVFNIIKMSIAMLICFYYAFTYETLIYNVTSPTIYDMIFGIALIIILIDATIKTVGKGMGIVTIAFLIYIFIGKYLPGTIGHAGFGLSRIVGHIFISSNGIFGSMVQISATYIALFTLLGAFLEKCGASDAFINIALKATGKMRGGPALGAVVASCIFGMVNGSAVVNVITTGTFTIPLMRSIGVAPQVAGAIEAAASTGGQLMPPIMGAGAFIMSDITGVPYSDITLKAIIPALVFFIGVLAGVYFYVLKEDVPFVDQEKIPSSKNVFKGFYLLLPLAVVFVMILKHYSPMYSAMAGIMFAILLTVVNNFIKLKKLFEKLGFAMVEGAINLSSVAMGLACAGIIVGVITLTGLGSKFVTMVILLSQGLPLLALVFVAVSCLILGMGLPTSAAYVITATMAVPAMAEMNFPIFASHLFVFYFAVIAPVTPPVAIAAYAGAGIAGASPNETGIKSFIFALPAFLIPFMFIYNPLLLAQGDLKLVLWAFLTAIIGTVTLAAATQGYFFGKINTILRFILGGAALCLIESSIVTDTIGLTVILIIFAILFFKRLNEIRIS